MQQKNENSKECFSWDGEVAEQDANLRSHPICQKTLQMRKDIWIDLKSAD